MNCWKMSESSEHRDLVVLMADGLRAKYPGAVIETDLQERPGDPVPPPIDGRRPDIYAHDKKKKLYVIGEAKTAADLDNKHTHAQIAAFVRYLEARGAGVFVLGVWGAKSDRAKTLLRFANIELELTTTRLQVFDGCDYWLLDPKGGIQWRLS